ncbi:hypothetical protein MJG53_015685 [Ovis ammon polii x Ovis aries]|uniref:Uncharacterized protein n=1 Tax=Ovis ammon polii x Ovis aries TaxID=2918886 RepID=A0ACB9UF87_9CETA|nr:hypothetical protein MJG53_015685 [Ovis ammon polii x Ovis aries]
MHSQGKGSRDPPQEKSLWVLLASRTLTLRSVSLIPSLLFFVSKTPAASAQGHRSPRGGPSPWCRGWSSQHLVYKGRGHRNPQKRLPDSAQQGGASSKLDTSSWGVQTGLQRSRSDGTTGQL